MASAPDSETAEPRDDAQTPASPLEAIARRYLKRWGLLDPAARDAAAQRLVARAEASGSGDPGATRRRIVALAGAWVEEFARSACGSDADWFFRARELLRRYPALFLETPCPASEPRERELGVLPPPVPRPMMQQSITD